MVFLDVNTFYGPKAGGIRTYHQAKLDWFARQNEHVYCLIHPGAAYRVDHPAPSVYVVQVPGIALTPDPEGYRLILDYLPVARWIRRLRPQVIEAGDAWLTSAFCLAARASGFWSGRLVSFYHSDPVPSYLLPWAAKGGLPRRVLASAASALFYAAQRRFDATAVASRAMEASLRAHGVVRVRRVPFGAHPIFFAAPSRAPLRRRGDAGQPVRYLYAGRLDRDKGVELLLEILPALLENPDAEVTVAGRGAFAARFEAFRHPRFRCVGFLEGRAALADLYGAHDVLLAPGPYETFGMAVLEGMACGLAIVGPDAGGTSELLVESGSPFRFRAGDAGAFLAQARRAAEADLPALSACSRETALRYGTWDDAIARMVAAWSEGPPA